MKTYLKYILIFSFLSLFAGVFYLKIYLPKISYETLTATKGSLNVSVQGIGNVNAKDTYNITAQTGGKILSIHTDIGQWVKKGELLIEIDGVDLPAQLSIAKANLEKAHYDIKAAQSELLNQKSRKNLLNATYERYKNLTNKNFASQSEYDKAKADLESVDAAINAATAYIDAAKAASIVAQKNVDAIKAKIQRLKVFSPIDGYVISKEAQVAQSVLPSTSILRVVDPKTLWVVTKIDERVSAKVRHGQSAEIRLRSRGNTLYKGEVKRIHAMSDPVTLEREIDIGFITIPQPFYINEQAFVTITVESFNNITKIPAKALVQNRGSFGVWIAQENKAHFTPLSILARSHEEVGVENFSLDNVILLPDANKKPLHEGMSIHL